MPCRGPRRTWWRESRAETRCSSTSWSSTSRAASRSIAGRRSASSTWTKCSGTRIQRQPEEAQRLLGVVAVSGRPIRQALAFQASELGAGGRVALASLRTARLIRCIGQTQHDEIEIYHDRIRETVVAHLPPDRLKWHHERLATVLPTAGLGRPRGPRRALPRGRRHRPRVRVLCPRGRSGRGGAGVRPRGAALPDRRGAPSRTGGPGPVPLEAAGRCADQRRPGAEAAQAYLTAASSATAAETLELKRLASTQLLISGHLDDGLALLRTLFGPLGMSMPDTPRRALASLDLASGPPPAARAPLPRARPDPGLRRWSSPGSTSAGRPSRA